ncbi:MAG: class I SAM-dependent methyltransferase [Gemmatimonadaceae bacterium]
MFDKDFKSTLATRESFVEDAYLRANPDVAAAVENGIFNSGRHHFDLFGHQEKRQLWISKEDGGPNLKLRKLQRIKSLLRDDMPFTESAIGFDFLTPQLRAEFNIIDTSAVSSNDYDGVARSLITKHANGMLLDCGAGKRREYFENVVNFEIVQYESTDVRGVGEVLPFKNDSFDAVISIAVLEHVKDPFQCAKELIRVLKPGGDLLCCVPFLQPYHGYPHHYYNMTAQGLTNLFQDSVLIDSVDVLDSVLPIWSLTWILQSWAEGLNGRTKKAFLDMKVSDLIGRPQTYLNAPFVRELSYEKNLELASACVLQARKK